VKSIVIAVACGKGGVGKTTTVKHLAALLAGNFGHRVTVLDMDGQSNLTDAILKTKPNNRPSPNLADVLEGKKSLTLDDVLVEAWISGFLNHLWIAPSDQAMDDVADDLVIKPLGTLRLKNAIERSSIDGYVLIDCPPNLGSLTFSALIAADYVVIPTVAEQWSIDGVSRLREKLSEIQNALGWSPCLLGTIATRVDERTKLHRAGLAQLNESFMPTVLGVIPECKSVDADVVRQAAYAPVAQTIFEGTGWTK
jgi:chromosome partitioning protein